jgi:predicted enzyme related to lactoylglutathione lyase
MIEGIEEAAMADRRWKHGEFCWYELATSDTAGARAFYKALFGWGERDVPTDEPPQFTVLRFRDEDLGAMYASGGPLQGLPPFWIAYIAVDDVDAAASAAKRLGAALVREPMDVPGVGRMAMLQDPQGALVAIIELTGHPGTGRWEAAPGTFCWSELAARDAESARAFYAAVVGWGTKTQSMGQTKYTEWLVGERSVGGMMPIAKEMGEIPPHWMHYVAVADCDATVETATALGGSVIAPPMDMPGVGRMAVLTDPQGAAFAVIRLE